MRRNWEIQRERERKQKKDKEDRPSRCLSKAHSQHASVPFCSVSVSVIRRAH